MIAKWLNTEPDIFILDEPTAGVDIGSKAEIIALVRDLAAKGKAVIVISSELAELLTAADRILVMVDGRIVSESSRRLSTIQIPATTKARRLQFAERQLSTILQKAHAHV